MILGRCMRKWSRTLRSFTRRYEITSYLSGKKNNGFPFKWPSPNLLDIHEWLVMTAPKNKTSPPYQYSPSCSLWCLCTLLTRKKCSNSCLHFQTAKHPVSSCCNCFWCFEWRSSEEVWLGRLVSCFQYLQRAGLLFELHRLPVKKIRN
jgi:hypothetical protein